MAGYLTTEGAAYILTTVGKGGTIAANSLFMALAIGTPTAASVMADVATLEHAATGSYARQNMTSANLTITGNQMTLAGAGVRFQTMTVTGATYWMVVGNGATATARNTTGTLIAYGALAATRNLTTADYLDVDFDWTLATT